MFDPARFAAMKAQVEANRAARGLTEAHVSFEPAEMFAEVERERAEERALILLGSPKPSKNIAR